MKRAIKNLIFAFIFIPTVVLVAQPGDLAKTLNQREVLTLDQFIELATKNPFFEEILINQLDLQYSQVLALPAQDWILSLKGEYGLLGRQGDSAKEGSTEHAFNGSISLSKLFAQSGTSIKSGFNALNWGGEARSGFYFNLAQPIAQNAFGKNSRRTIQLVAIQNEVAQTQILEAYEDYLSSLIILYYNWYSNYSRVLSALASYTTSQQLLNEMQQKFRYRIADQLDINKSELQLLSSSQSLLNQENSYLQQENEVLLAAGLNGEVKYKPELKDYIDFESLDFSNLQKLFFENSRTINTLEFLKKQKILQRDINADSLLPSATLYADYSVNGKGYSFEGGEINHNLQIGMTLDYSILSEKIMANVAKSDIEIQKQGLSAQNKILKLQLEIENFIGNLKRAKEVLDIQSRMFDLARSIAEAEQRDYNLGSSDLNFLINALNSQANYENQLINSKVQLNTLIVEFLRLTDSLVVKLP